MPYAVRADIDTIYPGVLDRIAWNYDTNEVDDDIVDAAISSAQAEIDMFCAQRYSLPLDPVPPMVKQFAVDIAVYRISLTRDKLTTEMRQRYEDVVARLTMLAKGQIGIGNPSINTDGTPTAAGGQDSNNQRAQFTIMRRQG